MSTVVTLPELPTVADLIEHLGGIPAERIRFRPLPGTATERDVIALRACEKRLCELVDGVLVEKTVGWYEELLASLLGHILWEFVEPRKLGVVFGSQGAMRLAPGLVRIPNVSYIARDRMAAVSRRDAFPALAPDLAVEVLSRSNTPREMQRKLHEYFEGGTRLVWYLDPDTRRMTVFTSPEQATVIDEWGVVDGGEVLPGFSLPLADLFARADRSRLEDR